MGVWGCGAANKSGDGRTALQFRILKMVKVQYICGDIQIYVTKNHESWHVSLTVLAVV